MQVILQLNKTVEQNAELYFAKAKKNKKKIEGVLKAIAIAEQKQQELEEKKERLKEQILEKEKENVQKTAVKKEWYEKFRWFFSSEGFLVIGGRDATTNEIVVKKHADKHDFIFHTDMAGSPFFIVKTEGRKPGQQTLQEAANATAIYSRAWKKGLVSNEVFYVTPEQVSKTANPGEYMGKGAFMIRGKTTYLNPDMRFAIGCDEKEQKIIAGPKSAIQQKTKNWIEVVQGEEKVSDLAKKIKHHLKAGDLDTIIAMLPSGGCALSKR